MCTWPEIADLAIAQNANSAVSHAIIEISRIGVVELVYYILYKILSNLGSYKDLVMKYQGQLKGACSKAKKATKSKSTTPFFSVS